ncbi:recombinase family protein [Azospirillum rugosum]|uniref:DNA invertase Pin-like site-specific DNA recombinase n=1 Tax=Azospirillum rugosum TaxID=416170 RepID=A0ABS4SX17_9PROT|nr:recombinase family protein [Azospirillum rugosum]MBP2296618.1 DNA invertase Pin-like site-specific DNA recombinase [Azospirillum rugosum]MDQ0530323.1 DNA invertase Pin-like site-specific DNA recombinase [Azospirillum rugosum]
MLVGYARTSTLDQVAGFEDQIEHLNRLGVEKVFSEQVSAVGHRPQLDACLDFVRDGDTLIVTRLDRLCRSTAHFCEVFDRLERKGAAIRVIDLGIDTSSPTGRMVAEIVVAVAAFERRLLLERQRVGIAVAKAEGRYKGRAPTARRRFAEVIELRQAGVLPGEIAARLGISRSSVFRALREAKVAA